MLYFRKSFNLIILLVCLVLSGCYVSPPTVDNPHDPFNHFNRDTNRLNTKLDKAFIKPVAKEYKVIIPYVIRRSIGDFFSNFDEPENFANDLLQGDVRWALNDAWRFIFNSTIGVAGFYDVAQHLGLPAHENDFGLTLNRWHLYSAYFVLPFVGPRTLGSSIAIPVDYYLGIEQHLIPLRYSVMLTTIYGINARAQLLNAEKSASGLILDQYIFYRSAYLQRRAYLLNINKVGPEYGDVQEDVSSD